jgi:valyl-tRNA synthetase
MIMSGYEFMGEAPFTNVFLHGTVRDAKGRKMSKSLGNGIDPLEVVDRFGADALRFTVLSMCGVGTDIHLDHEDLEAAFAPGRNFSNKLWNAGRFTLMSVGDTPVKPLSSVMSTLETSDRWILSRLQHAAAEMTESLERFRLDEAVDRAYHFFWSDFADWYLELSKGRLRGDRGDESRETARAVLVHVFDGILRLLHPIVPFVTEYLWDRIPWPEGVARPAGLSLAPWPKADRALENAKAEAALAAFQELVSNVRSLRKEYGVGEGAMVTLVVGGVSPEQRGFLEAEAPRLEQLARVGELHFGSSAGRGVGASAVTRDGTEIFLPLEGLIDLDQERRRLRAEIDRLDGQVAGAEKKLANEQFVGRAPAEVVQKEREKVGAFSEQRSKLQGKLSALEVS